MIFRRLLTTSVIILLSMLATPLVQAEMPNACQIDGVPRVKQITNYCGPATLASVLQHYGSKLTQQDIGKEIYNKKNGSTNGADMLYYARQKGFAAYSWNSGIEDVKTKINAGVPVIVLQQNSMKDASGHYRVLTGYDDARQRFDVVDPYYDEITSLSYEDCKKLWAKMGYWALLVAPKERDTFKTELDLQNPVVHMDMSYANYQRKNYSEALKNAQFALKLEPHNTFTRSMIFRIENAMGAGSRQ